MLSFLVRISLRHRGVVIALATIGLAYGLYSLINAKYDVFPEFATPQIAVQTEAPGLSPEQVEVLVTQPVENALNGAPGVESMRSESIQGLSLITINFDPKTDVYRDRQDIAERIATLGGRLPAGVQPVMTPLTSSTGDLLTIGLTSDKLTPMQLRTVADWIITPRLLAVDGVAKVSPYGGQVRQIQIQVVPERLLKYELTIDEIDAAARRATGLRGAGFIDTKNQRIVLRSEGGSLTASELAGVVVRHATTGNVTLGQVANVVDAAEPQISDASVNGHPAVVLNVWAQYLANTLEATRGVESALQQLAPVMKSEGITVAPRVFRAANYIELATHNINVALILGAVLVTVVLFLFLANMRSAAISCVAIPLSLLAGVAVLQALGQSLNTMTLGGLAIAIGEVVDDAVIDVENIQRRLREWRSGVGADRSLLDVVFEASLEVRSAVVYATFAVVLVFVPVLTMSGLAGRLFAPMALAYIFSILASLLVALTVTPALAALLLGGRMLEREERGWLQGLKGRYASILHRVENHPMEVIAGTAFVTIAGIALSIMIGKTFLPDLHETHYLVHLECAPGTSIGESSRIGRIAQRELLKLPFVREVAQRVGRAASDDVYGPQTSEIEVDLKSSMSSDTLDQIHTTLDAIPGGVFTVNTFLTERVEETLSGFTAPVVVQLAGNDLDALDAKAQEVARIISGIKGAADVQLQAPPGMPELVVRLRPADVARWGFDPIDVLDTLAVAYTGNVVGQVFDGSRVFDVALILNPADRSSIDAVAALPLRTPGGVYIHLRDVADVVQSAGRYAILHEGTRRAQTITAAVEGRDVSSFVAEVRRAVGPKVPASSGMYFEITGAAEAESASRRDLLVHSTIVLIAIGLLLSIVLGNARNLTLLAVNLPFALAGGVLAAFVTREPISVGSLVGFVTLFGITLRNSIMMISHYEHLVGVDGATWSIETAIRGASERLVPILMTSLVTALGLLPLALGRNSPGREIEGAMATVILGGLFTSTALNLLVLPTLAWRFGKFGAPSSHPPPRGYFGDDTTTMSLDTTPPPCAR